MVSFIPIARDAHISNNAPATSLRHNGSTERPEAVVMAQFIRTDDRVGGIHILAYGVRARKWTLYGSSTCNVNFTIIDVLGKPSEYCLLWTTKRDDGLQNN